MTGLLSDVHLGLGGRGDIANRPGLQCVLDHLLARRVALIAVLGDFLDAWRFGWGVVERNRDLLCHMGQEILGRGTRLVWVAGNHDQLSESRLATVAQQLAQYDLRGPLFTIAQGEFSFEDGGQPWLALHGHQWDKENAPDSWFQPVAHGVTWVSGQLGRVIPGWDDRYVNPANWVSAATRSESVRAIIRAGAADYAIERNAHVAFGHTHQLGDLESDYSPFHAVNVGCVSKGKAACVVVQGGAAECVPIMGF